MLLNASNCSNPELWGKELVYWGDKDFNKVMRSMLIPDEMDFSAQFLSYKWVYGIDNYKKING